MRRSWARFAVAALSTSLCAGAVLLVPSDSVRLPFAVLLLLVLPGYAMTCALFTNARLDGPWWLLLSVGLSVGIGILTALLLDLTVGLRRSSWTAALTMVIVGASAVGAWRRRTHLRSSRRMYLPQPGIGRAVLLMTSVAVIGSVLMFSRTPLPAKNVRGYSVLWLIPSTPHGESVIARVGVISGELQTTTYTVEVRDRARILLRRQLRLSPGEEWRSSVHTSSGSTRFRPVVASLYRPDRAKLPYRHVRIWAGERSS